MMALLSEGMSQDLDLAANLSYACADWLPFVSEKAVEEAAKHSFAGDLRIRAEQRACASWNVKAMPQAFNNPVRSNAAVLMVAGSDDPATPPRYGEAELRYLPNGREVLVRGAGHATELPCTDALIVEFVRAQSAKGQRTGASSCRGGAGRRGTCTRVKRRRAEEPSPPLLSTTSWIPPCRAARMGRMDTEWRGTHTARAVVCILPVALPGRSRAISSGRSFERGSRTRGGCPTTCSRFRRS